MINIIFVLLLVSKYGDSGAFSSLKHNYQNIFFFFGEQEDQIECIECLSNNKEIFIWRRCILEKYNSNTKALISVIRRHYIYVSFPSQSPVSQIIICHIE